MFHLLPLGKPTFARVDGYLDLKRVADFLRTVRSEELVTVTENRDVSRAISVTVTTGEARYRVPAGLAGAVRW